VSNLKYLNKTLTIVLIGVSFYSMQVLAQTAAKKKITLGDLIKKAKQESRGSKVNSLEKKSIALPFAQISFEEKKEVDLNEVKPPKLSEIYNYENIDQAAYEQTLNLQVEELYKLTQKFKSSSNRGELWLRLAELYVEKATILSHRKQLEYEKKSTDFQAGKGAKPILDLSDAKDFNKKAIQLYDWFLRDFPSDPKVSQALFFLGYNNFELGNVAEGTKYYNQLNAQHPSSQFAGESHFAVAENLFENEKWAEAYKEYSFLLKDNTHNLHTIALYKASWCLYRLGKTEEGIKYLDYIVKSGRRAKVNDSVNGKKINMARLENEAVKDLVIFFADTGNTKRAITYFKNLNTKESKESIEKLAYYLSNKGNREASKYVFNDLIAQDVSSKKAFEYQHQIVQNYFFSKNSPEFKSELYKWITNYNAKSSWYNANKSDQNFIKKSNQTREKTLRNYILQQHQAAQNSRAMFSQKAADDGYKLYFQEFSNSEMAGDMRFFYGELLYDMARYSDASSEYRAVVSLYPANQYIEKASQNILLAIEKSLPRDEDIQKRTGNSIVPIALDETIEKFIKSSNWYLQKYPKSDKAAEIKFRTGRLYYLTNNFNPAEKQFKEIVQQYPNTKYSEYSANLLLDIYNLKKDYVGLEKIGSELLADQSISNTKIGDDIRGVLEKASFKKAQNLESEKKYLESAKQFQFFAAQNAKSELVGMAYFNAGINFEKAGKNKEAVTNYIKVITLNNPQALVLKPKAKKLLAKLYQESGQFEEAAKLYSELAQVNTIDLQYDNYLYNSALMLEITGRNYEAIKEYENYLRVGKNKEENALVNFKIAELLRKNERLTDSLAAYRRFAEILHATVNKKIEAQYWIYELSRRLNIKIHAHSVEVKIRSLIAALPDTNNKSANTYLAKIKLAQAAEVFSELKAVYIPINSAQQKIAVDKKLELMSVLNELIGGVIRLDSAEELVSALYILGESNEHMAHEFSSVPVPTNLNDEQKKLYLVEIEKIITPFTNKSEESYKLAIERAIDLQVYNQAYSNAFMKMHKKYPEQFYSSGEASSESKIIDWMGDK
jgi:TolA-binding protein